METDQLFASVVALLHADGVNGQANNVFLDSSTNVYPVTAVGGPAQGSPSPYARGGGSVQFSAEGDCLSLSAPAGLALGTGDFTVEWWEFCTTAAAMYRCDWRPVGGGSTGIVVSGAASGAPSAIVGPAQISAPAAALNTWQHYAIVRSAGTFKFYVGGVAVNAGIASTTNISVGAGRPLIGASGFGASPTSTFVGGRIVDFRVVKDVAVYTGSFTPPSEPLTAIAGTQLLLSCTNAGIVDTARKSYWKTVGDAKLSTAQSKFGGSSIIFDGTGDNILGPSNADFTFGTGDFTIEMWFRPTNFTGATPMLYETRPGANGAYPCLNVGSSKLNYLTNNFTPIPGVTTLVAGTWYHAAVSRVSGQTRLFLNGGQEGSSYADTTNYLIGSGPLIGGSPALSTTFTGHIDEVRVTKGVGRYTTNFTPPSAPFPDSG
jgi:hypothetical protein